MTSKAEVFFCADYVKFFTSEFRYVFFQIEEIFLYSQSSNRWFFNKGKMVFLYEAAVISRRL